jgi:hypothetical protein
MVPIISGSIRPNSDKGPEGSARVDVVIIQMDGERAVRRSIENSRDHLPMFLAIFVMFMAPLIISDPLGTFARLLGTVIVVGTVVVVVKRFRLFTKNRVPSSWLEHRSKTVRVGTRAVRAYGTYLVGFYTLIAMLLLFQVLGHFL